MCQRLSTRRETERERFLTPFRLSWHRNIPSTFSPPLCLYSTANRLSQSAMAWWSSFWGPNYAYKYMHAYLSSQFTLCSDPCMRESCLPAGNYNWTVSLGTVMFDFQNLDSLWKVNHWMVSTEVFESLCELIRLLLKLRSQKFPDFESNPVDSFTLRRII